ncbi:hypothetical protein HBI56_230930 [Parastagonospora nodorum]|nr:hypothetical protein HBH56_223870 [Parastagonospora nodorum]QRD04332.1 hypothetical protein JI435_443350 [Parastagonospora nodorum SN15]KAH3921954.1 hypothetical protein HBH54_232020 [Parastagonospora nodorum]KAH3939400.1 hypothetical protein HBH53_234780 [Parastagonospora nodorum]KAH3957177.1 hypothetical protein HBH51_228150 [Parastagonospora nodorum]
MSVLQLSEVKYNDSLPTPAESSVDLMASRSMASFLLFYGGLTSDDSPLSSIMT